MNIKSFAFRAGQFASSPLGRTAFMVTTAVVLSACSAESVPTAADFKDGPAISAWSCSVINSIMPIVWGVSLLFAVLGVALFGVSKFGAGVLPGGLMSWTQQNMQNIIVGTIVLVVAPTAIVAVIGAASGLDVAACTFK